MSQELSLTDCEGGLLERLDGLLRRNIISEAEFERANQAEQERNARLGVGRSELKGWLDKKRDRASLGKQLPQFIGTFLEALESLGPRQQKTRLQTVLKAACVYTDSRIGLEFSE